MNEKDYITLFSKLFEQYYKKLYIHAMSLVRDTEVAGDMTHDVFITIWRDRTKIDFQQPIFPYLMSLIRNRCLNHLEHRKVQKRYELKQLNASEIYDAFKADNEDVLIEHIIQRIDTLPEKCRSVMRMCFLECKKYREIASAMNISVNTVKYHISHGLSILREEFPESPILFLYLYHQKNIHFPRKEAYPFSFHSCVYIKHEKNTGNGKQRRLR